MSCTFSWQAQHFGDLHVHFAKQALHLRHTTLQVFGESHCQGCMQQRANCAAGVGHRECVILRGRRCIW